MVVKARPGSASAARADRLMGPLVTAATVLGVNSLTGGEFIEHPLYLACVVYSVFRGGIGAGLASSALIVCDALIREIAAPFGLDEPFRHVKIVALACLVVVLVTGHLKRRADRASELSQVNRQLTGQLSERARSEEAAVALAAMTRDLVEPLDLSRLHHRIVATIQDLFRVRQAMLYQLDAASQELTCVATAGDVDDTRWLGHRLPAGEVIAGGSALAQARVIPLRVRGKVLGALTLEGALTRDIDLQLLSIIAGHAALALENSRLYAELRATLEQPGGFHDPLVDEARLRATEELAAGVAHHVNNRLMVILAGIQLLKPKLDDAHHRSLLEIGEQATLDTARLVDRLRQCSVRRPYGASESADLNLAVQRAVELCRADQAEARARGARVEIVVEPGPVPRVVADEALLEEALAHVVRNAIEAITDRGMVTITTAPGGAVLCVVADTGRGMSDDVRQRAAQPFFTTKGPQRLGLGLSASLGIVRQLGGQLEIRSEVDLGTRVSVRLRPYIC
jgi:signal transduction histidine kinase